MKIGRRRVLNIPLDPQLVCFLRSEISPNDGATEIRFQHSCLRIKRAQRDSAKFSNDTILMWPSIFSVIFIIKANEKKRHQSYERNATVLLDLGIEVKISLVHC